MRANTLFISLKLIISKKILLRDEIELVIDTKQYRCAAMMQPHNATKTKTNVHCATN